jgi:CBS domain-containing protein
MQRISDVMTADVTTCPQDATIEDAARLMRQEDIGDVLVTDEEGRLAGIVTDRDIVVRALAEGRSPGETPVRDVLTTEVVALEPKDAVDRAVQVMRDGAVRRVPVVEDGRPVGIVSIGDLAVERDPDSALADISAAEPNQ